MVKALNGGLAMKIVSFIFLILFSTFAFSKNRCELISSSFTPYSPGDAYHTYGVFGSLFDGHVNYVEIISSSKISVTYHGGEYWDASTSLFSCEKTSKKATLLCRQKGEPSDSFYLEKTEDGYTAYSNKDDYASETVISVDLGCKKKD